MNINSNQKTELAFHLQYLSNFENNGFKIENINFVTKELTFVKENETNKYKFKFEEIISMQNMEGENDLTSEMQTDQNIDGRDLSETSYNQSLQSPLPISNKNTYVQSGGDNKNIFKSSKYSDTSSVKFTEMSNYSKTSSVMYNDRSDNFSETSVIGQIGGKIETSDTLMSISELKDRKKKSNSKMSSSTSTFNTNLNVGIFKKSQTQSGGANTDIKKKMLEAGINSSSTSSICE
jgi:uncharacterized protein YkuJ